MPVSQPSQRFSRQNAALGVYVSAWQHECISKSIEITKEKHAMLTAAMENYRAWQNRTPHKKPEFQNIATHKLANLFDCGGEGPALLLVPSVINGHEILDITPDDSLRAYLKSSGFHVYLLDWKPPQQQDANQALDYCKAITELAEIIPDQTIFAVGYCIGGTFLQMAASQSDKFEAISLLGAPWNFHHDETRMGQWAQKLNAQDHNQFFDQIDQRFGLLPSTNLDYFFAMLNPFQFIEKFAKTPIDLGKFDAAEDWLTNGRDVDMGFARELFCDWLAQNTLITQNFTQNRPTLLIYGVNDHIAPPASCRPLMKHLDNVQEICHPSGHMGLLIGKAAQREVWPKLANFFKTHLAQ